MSFKNLTTHDTNMNTKTGVSSVSRVFTGRDKGAYGGFLNQSSSSKIIGLYDRNNNSMMDKSLFAPNTSEREFTFQNPKYVRYNGDVTNSKTSLTPKKNMTTFDFKSMNNSEAYQPRKKYFENKQSEAV